MAHFEIHVNDTARAQAFYAELFGWSYAPIEKRNLAGERPDVVAELRAKLDAYPQPVMKK